MDVRKALRQARAVHATYPHVVVVLFEQEGGELVALGNDAHAVAGVRRDTPHYLASGVPVYRVPSADAAALLARFARHGRRVALCRQKEEA